MKVGVISNNDFCLPLLFYLLKSKADINLFLGNASVIDQKREGVKNFCTGYNIQFCDQTASGVTVYQWLNDWAPEIVFTISHLQKIDLGKVKAQLPIYNIHFGKLPQYRGVSPLFWQLKNMEKTIGCSIHAMTNELDAGPIYWEKEILNEDHFTHAYVQYLFSNLVVEGVNDILIKTSNGTLQSKQQDEQAAHTFPRPSLSDVLIRWDKMPAAEVCALVRACNNWNVGAITLYQGLEMKIIDASYAHSNLSQKIPGAIVESTNSIDVSCINGDLLSIHYLSLNGIPFPGRQAKKFGITSGEMLTYPSD